MSSSYPMRVNVDAPSSPTLITVLRRILEFQYPHSNIVTIQVVCGKFMQIKI